MPHHDEAVGTQERRVDTLTVTLYDGIGAFDAATSAQRWATIKIALRLILVLAHLARGRMEVDG